MVVTTRQTLILPLFAALFLGALALAGCARQQPKVTMFAPLKPAVEQETVYVAPFVTTLVPEAFGEPAFNEFVDYLNAGRGPTGIKRFLIFKDDLKEIDPAWLAHQTYITGEIWSYVENSGCCQTELRVKGRVALFEPGNREPSAAIVLPLDSFFDHDATTLEAERQKLATRLADELAAQILMLLRRQ